VRHRRRRHAWRSSGVVLVAASALTACTGDDPANRRQPGTSALTAVECPADVRTAIVGGLDCAYLRVPENRDRPGSGDVKIFVATLAAPAGSGKRDPLLVTSLANQPNYGGIAPLAQRLGRDVIIVDTRGAGHSTPSLDCPEVAAAAPRIWTRPTGDAAGRAAVQAAVGTCHQRLTAAGVQPQSYDLVEAARDLETLRHELDVETWNVIGYGVGTRLALELLRQAPDTIRTLVLDSPELPGTDPRSVAGAATEDAVRALLAACERDASCRREHPHAAGLLDQAMRSLQQEPLVLDVEVAGERLPLVFDAGFLARALRQLLSDTGSSGALFLPGSVPGFLEDVVSRRVATLAADAARLVQYEDPLCLGYRTPCLPAHHVATGVELTVLCRDVAPFADRDDRALGAGFREAYGASPYWTLCDAWPVDPAPAEVATAASSDVPALIAVGGYPPYSPHAVIRGASSGLSAASLVIDPGGTHNVVPRPCVNQARNRWVDDPHPLTVDPCSQERGIAWN
jgi:pimeloyl-ACP methyl ester carboxylesterase